MWKQYVVYRCPHCGHQRKSNQRIYRFDSDSYHEIAFSEDRDMRAALSEVQDRPCPKCNQNGFEWVGWSEY